ncbi:hypothetical protein ACO0M4_38690 [Streptomyces sp. RGM 3693]|uniref:hypothetical protein n=1 Tax=Streptomyces sp. RGM 3693 TaxID=3413284 RepID=UPI003D29836E
MRSYIDHHEFVGRAEFEELAFGFDEFPLGVDRDLFRGPLEPETPDEHQARLDAARDVLADLREQAEAGDEGAAWDTLYADALAAVAPLRRTRRARRSAGAEVAA